MEKTIVFNNKKYRWDGKYYQGEIRLHRAIWEYYNGKIPKGHHIHHIDKDRTNNEISNLEIKEIRLHLSEHSKEMWATEGFKEKMSDHLKDIGELAKEWHSSKEGIKWHKEHGKKTWVNRKVFKKKCEVCREEYETYFPNRSRFCHDNCKAKALRKRRRLQLNSGERT